MKNLFTTLFLLTLNLTLTGQHTFGFKLNGGISRISNSSYSSNTTNKVQIAPSGQGGFYYYNELGSNSILGAELIFSQIGGKDKMEIDFLEGGNIVGHGTVKLYKHISYLSLPIYYGFKINNLIINVGFQLSYTLFSRGRQKGESTINGEQYSHDTKSESLNIDPLDYGPRAGVIYKLNNQFEIEANYYYGVNNIIANNGPDWIWKIQQATVGIRYNFLTTDKKNKK